MRDLDGDSRMTDPPPEALDATCSRCNEGGKGTYTMPGRCGNCGRSYVVTLSRSHTFLAVLCPYCGCKTLRRYL